MDPRLLQFYNQELAHVRDSAAEFAERFPKIAARLAMDSTEVQDPYVERLLEGFAFLAARIQLRLHEEFPRFTEQLLDHISPNFLAPTPSMGVVQFNPQLTDGALKQGVRVEAGTVLKSHVAKGVGTPCSFRVGHSLTLWPLRIDQITHGPCNGSGLSGLPRTRSNPQHDTPHHAFIKAPKSALVVSLSCTTSGGVQQLQFDYLDFHVSCAQEYAFRVFERIAHGRVALGVRATGQAAWHWLGDSSLQLLGLEPDEALVPHDTRQFSGHRLLQEFFAFPERFLFFRVNGLRRFVEQCPANGIELCFGFEDQQPDLDRALGDDTLALNCAPVVNLFEHACDRIALDERTHEAHVVPNRTRPLDYEVHSVLQVQGHGPGHVQDIPAMYAQPLGGQHDKPRYHTKRVLRQLSEKTRREGGRSAYVGSEVYLALTEPHGQVIHDHGLQQLSVKALCSNRDLPLLMPLGQMSTDLVWPGHLPLSSVRFLRGPSRPKPPIAQGRSSWQLIEQLSLNYLGLVSDAGAASFARLLGLHADATQATHRSFAQAVHSVDSSVLVQQVLRRGRPVVVRGVQVTLVLDEEALQGTGMAVLGQLLARCVATHVSVNSFVQTVVRSLQTGRTLTFKAMSGDRPLL